MVRCYPSCLLPNWFNVYVPYILTAEVIKLSLIEYGAWLLILRILKYAKEFSAEEKIEIKRNAQEDGANSREAVARRPFLVGLKIQYWVRFPRQIT